MELLAAWRDTNVTVLGRAAWTMSSAHTALVLAILHLVYAAIALGCDLLFFHALARRLVASSYLETVLPCHRLFYTVISCMDGLIFAASTNISSILGGSALPAALIVLITFVILADTFILQVDQQRKYFWHLLAYILQMSARAARGEAGAVFARPWRNLVAGAVVAGLLAQALAAAHPAYTWDTLVLALFCVAALLLAAKLVRDSCAGRAEAAAVSMEHVVSLLVSVSVTNVLGLFSVATVSHVLIFRYYNQISEYL